MRYRLNEHARREIVEIWAHIGADNLRAADRWLETMFHHFEMLADMPYMGRSRDELKADYRSFPTGNYTIFYRMIGELIEIMHILHSRRDVEHFTF